MKEAKFYKVLNNKKVQCVLCPHMCKIEEGKSGFCKVRNNIDGILYTKTYNKISSIALDPIEKKPLRQYKPNSKILSVGTYGCNFTCDFCQNYHISQMEPELETISPTKLLEISDNINESIGIAFTYNEPTIWYEYIYDVAKNNKKDTILVTNGYINKEPLKELLPYINAMNIDIKSMNSKFYDTICNGTLESVKKTIILAYEKTHVELTFLAIPNINDSNKEMVELATWMNNIDFNIPLHIIPFRPMYNMKYIPKQTYERINRLKEIALRYLKYVY